MAEIAAIHQIREVATATDDCGMVTITYNDDGDEHGKSCPQDDDD